MNPIFALLVTIVAASETAPTKRTRRRGLRERERNATRARSSSSTRGLPGRVGTASEGWQDPVDFEAIWVADFRGEPGTYKDANLPKTCITGIICVGGSKIPVGFSTDWIPPQPYLTEVFSASTKIRVRASVELRAAKGDKGDRWTGDLRRYPDACTRVEFEGVVGEELGVSDVAVTSIWTRGVPPEGAVGKTQTTTPECAFAVGSQIPRITCVTLEGGSRRVVFSLEPMQRSSVRIAFDAEFSTFNPDRE